MLNAFRERIMEDDMYLSLPVDHSDYHSFFNYDFGYGEINPSYVVQLQILLPQWKKLLAAQKLLVEDRFEDNGLTAHKDHIIYKDIKADKVIFCDGIHSAQSRWFKNLPFALNKGEALLIKAKDLPPDRVYKKGITLVPLSHDYFWAGASYEWDYADEKPSISFLERTMKQLELWLKVPFVLEAHLASVRPATIERRPFIGMHPHHPSIGIFNGMGTKGCSLAPYFAHQFVNHLTKNTPILPEVSISRFTRILQSTQ
jgi:glycine/D-amino acid oxidase-like deaminating enzyme